MFYLHICTDCSTPMQISEINRKQMKSEQTKNFKILSKTLIDLKFKSRPRECFSLFLKSLNGQSGLQLTLYMNILKINYFYTEIWIEIRDSKKHILYITQSLNSGNDFIFSFCNTILNSKENL